SAITEETRDLGLVRMTIRKRSTRTIRSTKLGRGLGNAGIFECASGWRGTMRGRHVMRHRVSRGFSLVELLVVVGIITLLAGILLPAVNKARESAKRIQCMSNVRQLTVAWLTYAN